MDLQYFQSYNSLEIHEFMLKDKIRNLTYLKVLIFLISLLIFIKKVYRRK
jgi:hypothetical protein